MPKVSISNQDIVTNPPLNTRSGLILGGGNTFVRVNGKLVAVQDDLVAPHSGGSSHQDPTNKIIQGSSHARINGTPICVEGSKAKCGDTATGSEHVSYEE